MCNWGMTIENAESIQNSDSMLVTCHLAKQKVEEPAGECLPPAQSDLASERLVLETEHFVVSAPFACRERWRLYLAPKRHSPDAWHRWIFGLRVRQKSSLDILLNVQGQYHLVA